jgi:flavin prenyltransferase
LASDAGAVIYPVIPTFYDQPTDSATMARQFVFRVLDFAGLPQDEMYRWKSAKKK